MILLKTKIIAHRGASKYAPENTMPAFELAYEMKADGIETDVQMTRDGVPVLIHDETLQRTTNGHGFVKDMDWKDLEYLDAGNYFSPKFADTRLPTLEQFLAWASDKALYINLELKNDKVDYKDLEVKVLDLLRKFEMKNRTTISSFNPESVKRMRKLDANLDVALLRSRKHPDLAQYAKDLGASSLHVKHTLLNRSLIEACGNLNLPVRIYTVNSTLLIRKGLRYNCAGIITDVPDKAIFIRNTFQ